MEDKCSKNQSDSEEESSKIHPESCNDIGAAEEEEKSRNVYDPDQNLMEAALHRVLAMDEMERLQYEIRQVMVYQTPGMGDLYTRVIKMVGVISEEQEFARMQKVKEIGRAHV